jgi:hypothetical protein
MIKRFYYLTVFSIVLLLTSCKKEDKKPEEPSTPPVENTDTSDVSVSFNKYVLGTIYYNDTIRFDFNIKNLDSKKINQGSSILAASKFGSTTFALDLIGPGPSTITVPSDLNQNQSFNNNSGYLLASSVLAYFALDSMDISIMLYGPSGSAIDENFPKDRTPSNNKATLKIKANQIMVKP